MERLTSLDDIIGEIDRYVVAFMTQEECLAIPSVRGIYFYDLDEDSVEAERDKMMFLYARNAFYNYGLIEQPTEILEEIKKYKSGDEEVEVEPAFYIRRSPVWQTITNT